MKFDGPERACTCVYYEGQATERLQADFIQISRALGNPGVDDGAVYLLRVDDAADRWELVKFERAPAEATRR